MTLAVADTHALLWYLQNKRGKLGSSSRRFFDRVDAGTASVFVPVTVMVEICESARAGEISLPGGFSAWGEALFASGFFHSVDLTWSIVRRSEELFAIPERGDRLIAATASELGVPLITRDPEIANAAGVDILW
jgi:PIN domain nuclease of toxin-antitoxin system